MPIYRYRCDACQQTTEVWARMSDPPPETCEACGGGPMRKAVARTAFHLKGGGWYAQGYGAGGSKGGSSDSGAGSGSGTGDSGSASDSGSSSDSGSTSSDSGSSSASSDP